MKGKAYALFDCPKDIDDIKTEVFSIRRIIETPSYLEVLIFSRKDFVSGPVLSSIAEKLGFPYVAEVAFPLHSNKDAADELASMLNQASNSPLYDNPEDFRGEIIYRDIPSWIKCLLKNEKGYLGYVFHE
ncbi:hypothetical protein J4476_03355 [Candidatus Woesearchaeota archaeon]|nr:MAG: hypothetical protein QT09_C0006G0018 [archaeon GW2011_AR18]MBS3161706.1 hypothetical protein [Candidatus Woesearchaeota archaeon]HIH25717.1 hypothetical protein [Nanoarchaeota archaeon]